MLLAAMRLYRPSDRLLVERLKLAKPQLEEATL